MISESFYAKVISVLKRKKGKTVRLQQLERELSVNPKGKVRKTRRVNQELELFLQKLSEHHLIDYDGEEIIPSHPFAVEGWLSATRSGHAFVVTTYGDDISIHRKSRKGAHHRDRVLTEITGYSGSRFEGEIVETIQPFSQEYIAKTVNRSREGILISLIDLPDAPYGLITQKNPRELKMGLWLKVAPENKQIETLLPPLPGKKKNSFFRSVPVYRIVNIAEHNDTSFDFERIALKYSLPLNWSKNLIPEKKALREREKEGERDPERKKLTKLYTCTIDGADAKDFDDAISLQKQRDRTILHVHIADVSWYVEPGSALDHEALNRSNSFYLNNQVLPMLPSILSEDFCSLRPKTKRLALTAEIHYNENLDPIETHFYRSLIYVNKRFTYTEAEKEIDRKNSVLKPFWDFALALYQKRTGDGRVDLNLKDIGAVYDNTGKFSGMVERERLRSHRLIEECMLSANTEVARHAREKDIPMLHRNHEPIPTASLPRLNLFLTLYGHNEQLKDTSHQEINRAIRIVEGSREEHVFNTFLLRSFTQAYYHPVPKGHWGLAFRDYTHFTSPIRRYSDLVVHRQLIAHIQKKPGIYSSGDLLMIGEQTSTQERIAMEAERSMLKLHALRFMENNIGREYAAFFTGFHSNGLFIALDEPSFDGFIPAESFSHRGEVNALDNFRVMIPSLQKVIFLGSRMRVRLEETNKERMQLVFSILSLSDS